ncbi:hypothetical protein BO224_01630 [Erysipelotrichaceae bacterium NYU-BL-E8]|uniref:Uncharacterized protein n=1 Tax=Ileibacterium valens TaxID=1862668 RepID=A0A1U7NI19_9FIRM|nr:hypothetical protein BM735_12555 [Erysipelotrichaceae bacterium NYU-BL-F16]OLU41796.1 hypothetical protein BO222_02615 [Ileibacterium valens]OLU42648.1 hypothetical protein BO224_01630 [Erysipelotrichaceae bacterium NYU-BL-E8]
MKRNSVHSSVLHHYPRENSSVDHKSVSIQLTPVSDIFNKPSGNIHFRFPSEKKSKNLTEFLNFSDLKNTESKTRYRMAESASEKKDVPVNIL